MTTCEFRGIGGLPCGASQEGLDADEEDIEVEGLGEVVVGAGFEAVEDVLRAGAGGEHEDGSEALGVAQGAGYGEAVGSGQHAVEDDGCDGLGWGEEIGEGGVAVGFVVGAITLGGKVEEQTLGEVLFVFDEGDERGERVCIAFYHLRLESGIRILRKKFNLDLSLCELKVKVRSEQNMFI